MKKFLIALTTILIITGCGNTKLDNTPTKKVEEYFNKYQTLDQDVLDDLDSALASDTTLSDEDREDYKDFMKKHYQDLKYEIKDETIDGDIATVETEITVRDYTTAVSDADNEKDTFTKEDGTVDNVKFSNYRLEELEKVKDTVTYTLNLTLTKQNDEWKLDQLSDEDLNKINGLYSE